MYEKTKSLVLTMQNYTDNPTPPNHFNESPIFFSKSLQTRQKVVTNRGSERNKTGEMPYLIIFQWAVKIFLADGKNNRSGRRKISLRPLRS